MDSDFNIFEISEDALRFIDTTIDIDVIEEIVQAFEELKGDEEYTRRIPLRIPSRNNLPFFIILEVLPNYKLIKRFMDVCFNSEEYEMCTRIKLVIEKIGWEKTGK